MHAHAGDHLQLPPTVLSDKAATEGLSVTLFERLHRMHYHAAHMLSTQYRMHADIMTWASNALYKGKLQAHASVAAHTLADIRTKYAVPLLNVQARRLLVPLQLLQTVRQAV